MDKLQEYGELNTIESMELTTLSNKLLSIESLLQRLIIEQESYNIKREAWFIRIRDKYNIPYDVPIVIEDRKILLDSK